MATEFHSEGVGVTNYQVVGSIVGSDRQGSRHVYISKWLQNFVVKVSEWPITKSVVGSNSHNCQIMTS